LWSVDSVHPCFLGPSTSTPATWSVIVRSVNFRAPDRSLITGLILPEQKRIAKLAIRQVFMPRAHQVPGLVQFGDYWFQLNLHNAAICEYLICFIWNWQISWQSTSIVIGSRKLAIADNWCVNDRKSILLLEKSWSLELEYKISSTAQPYSSIADQ